MKYQIYEYRKFLSGVPEVKLLACVMDKKLAEEYCDIKNQGVPASQKTDLKYYMESVMEDVELREFIAAFHKFKSNTAE